MASKKRKLVGVPTGYRTNYGRTIYKTPDLPPPVAKGENVSEKSVTFKMDGRWINIPSIHDGIRYTHKEVIEQYRNGEIEATSVHKSKKAAEKAAAKRSKEMRHVPKAHARRSGGIVKKAYNNSTRKASYK